MEEVIETDVVIERDLSLESAVQISRQWGVLLDDYRYLLEKFSADCSCHLKFDNMFFLKSMEQRYETLKKIANDNEYLSAFSNDENDWTTLNNLWQNKAVKASETGMPQMIRRITVINDTHTDSSNTQNSISTISFSNTANEPEPSLNKRSKRQFEKVDTSAEDSETHDSDIINLPSKVYKCDVKECSFTTMNEAKFQEHICFHQGIPGSVVVSDSVLHICHDCGKEFSTEDGLKNHIQNSHVDVKMWSCEIAGCKYTTKFRSCFRDHMIRHSGRKNHHCEWPDCGKDFSTRRDLMAHVNFHHNCVRRFQCDHEGCDQSFKDSNRLKHHQYIHTGERPYKCMYSGCEAKFKQIPHLKKHEKIHLNKQAEEQEESEEYAVWKVE